MQGCAKLLIFAPGLCREVYQGQRLATQGHRAPCGEAFRGRPLRSEVRLMRHIRTKAVEHDAEGASRLLGLASVEAWRLLELSGGSGDL